MPFQALPDYSPAEVMSLVAETVQSVCRREVLDEFIGRLLQDAVLIGQIVRPLVAFQPFIHLVSGEWHKRSVLSEING